MTRTVCIVQARLASTRLPAKVLLPLPTGRTVLEEVVWRCEQIEGVDQVVVAVPDNEGGRMVGKSLHRAQEAKGKRVSFVVPCPFDESDVLARYAYVAKLTKADRVLRVTSDCPLISGFECARVLDECVHGARYARLWAGGWSCEAFTAEALYVADQSATDAYDREHVGPWMANNIMPRTVNKLQASDPPPSLDTIEDYIRIVGIFNDERQLRITPVSERPDEAVHILWDLLAERPAIANISHVRMPSSEDHEAFVENHPYHEWYLIEVEGQFVGAIYLTHAYEIGIAVFAQHQRKGYAKQAVYKLMAEHGKQRYLANVAPGNEASKAFWQKLGFRHIQETYCAD